MKYLISGVVGVIMGVLTTFVLRPELYGYSGLVSAWFTVIIWIKLNNREQRKYEEQHDAQIRAAMDAVAIQHKFRPESKLKKELSKNWGKVLDE